jgi:hypothetical protein
MHVQLVMLRVRRVGDSGSARKKRAHAVDVRLGSSSSGGSSSSSRISDGVDVLAEADGRRNRRIGC